MEYINACPLCKTREFDLFLKSRDYFYSGKEFNIVKCRSCNFLFTNPRPEETEAAGYYYSEAYISHSNSGKGLINQIYKTVRRYSLNKKTRIVKNYIPSGRLLDIGSGTGHFAHHLSSRGFEVTGVEPGEPARQFAKDHFKLQVEADLQKLLSDRNQFDAITMWHVLEHVYTLHDYLDNIRTLLSNKGVLIVAVPNPDSYDALYYKEFWAAYDLPRHLYHFRKSSFERLMSQHQFELVNVYPMKFDSYYVSLLSEKYKRGKNNFALALLKGMQSNFYALSNQNNYSSLIYILKAKIS